MKLPYWKLVLLAAVAVAAAPNPCAGQDAPPPPPRLHAYSLPAEGIRQIMTVRRGSIVWTLHEGKVRQWDVRNGQDMGYWLSPDGQPVELTAAPVLINEQQQMLLLLADGIWVVDTATLAVRHQFAFHGATAATIDSQHDRLLVSAPVNRRNEIAGIDLSSGQVERLARLRGLSREDSNPHFSQMQILSDGNLVGTNGSSLMVIDTQTWQMTASDDSGSALFPWQVLPGDFVLKAFATPNTRRASVLVYDARTLGMNGRVSWETDAPPKAFSLAGPMAYDPRDRRVLVHYDRGFAWIDLAAVALIENREGEQIHAGLQRIYGMSWNRHRNEYLLCTDAGGLSLSAWSGQTAQPRQQFGTPLLGFLNPSIRPVPGTARFFIGSRLLLDLTEGRVRVNRLEPTLSKDDHGLTYDTNRIISGDGQYVAQLSRDRIALYDATGHEKWSQPLPDRGGRTFERKEGGGFSGDNSRLMVIAPQPTAEGTPRVVVLFGLSAASGELIWRQDNVGEDQIWLVNVDAGHFRTLDRKRMVLQTYRWADGERVHETGLSGFDAERLSAANWFRELAYARDATGKRLLLSDGARLGLFDLEAGAFVVEPTLLQGGTVGQLEFAGNGAFIVNGLPDRLQLRSPDDLSVIVELLLFANDDNWVVTTPDHRFDATPEGQDRLFFEQAHRLLPLSLFFERAYTPDLLAKRLRGEALPSPDLTVLPTPPSVKLTLADLGTRGLVVEEDTASGIRVQNERVRLRYEASGGGVAVEEVRIFHNGKALEIGTRGLIVENDVPVPVPELTREVEVLLVPGSNHFEAVAVNALRIESAGSSVTLDYLPVDGRTGVHVDLHLLVVAVNQYENANYNLNYAVKDARAFRDAMRQHSAGLFRNIHARLLLDADVSKESMMQAFREVGHQAQPQDVFVFFYAGHGVMSQEEVPEFFIVPPDVRQLYGNNALLRERAVAAQELRQLARGIPAQKQLFILDACQSAGAFSDYALRGASQERALAQLARSTGTHWLAASGSQQFAAEFETLGHGAFTYALLEAFANRSVDAGTSFLTVRDLDAFLQQRVPELTREHRGTPQYPASFGFGQDFPLISW